MLSPRQIFEDNIRPADLLLKVYRLLEHDAPNTEVGVLQTLRELVKADHDEGLMVIYNEVFLGLIRERAEVHQHLSSAVPCAISCGSLWSLPAPPWKPTCRSSCGTICRRSFGFGGGISCPRRT